MTTTPPIDGIRFIEFPDLQHGSDYGADEDVKKPAFPPHSEWTELITAESEIEFVFKLKPLTQSLWIQCNDKYNFHLSPLPLRVRDPTKYEAKKKVISDRFGAEPPPNVILFVLDSTARSVFTRHAVSTMQYLNELHLDLQNKSKTDIFQFFRYSTVAWGTGQNLSGLMGGQCQICDNLKSACWGLGDFYDDMGYNVMGLSDGFRVKGTKWSSGCRFILSSDVLPQDSCSYSVDDWSNGVDLALDAIHNQMTIDQGIPYFVPLHVSSNHVEFGRWMSSVDRFVRRLVEYVDKQRTIVHIVADHGTLVGKWDINEYGVREMKNPVSIMMVPKLLTQQKLINEFKNLKANEQRPVNHYDFHLFYKQLLLKLAVSALPQKITDRVNASWPRLGDGQMMAQSVMDQVIPFENGCHGIMNGYCFCNVMMSLDIDENLRLKDAPFIQRIVNTINAVTGNGQWLCSKLKATDFVLVSHTADERGKLMIIGIELDVDDPEEREHLLKNNNLLSYVATFSRENVDKVFVIGSTSRAQRHYIPNIVRIDYFNKEQCLTTNYERTQYRKLDAYFDQKYEAMAGNEPMFVDEQMNKLMLKQSAASKQLWNLRLCRCK